MAKGFKYFPFPTDIFEDPRVMRLANGTGHKGIAVYLYILNSIYRDGVGGVLQWDERRVLNAAAYFGLKESLVCEIVEQCGALGLFERTLFPSAVITSADTQHQYVEMCRKTKRQVPIIPEEYRLIPQENPPEKVREELPKLTEVFPKVREELPKTPKKLDKVFKNIQSSNDDVYIDPATIGMKEVGEWIDTCLSQSMWVDSIRMKYRKPGEETMSVDELTALLHSFAEHCVCTGAERKTLRDFKAHFTFWLDKQPVKQKDKVRSNTPLPASQLTPEQEAQRRALASDALKLFK